MNTEANPTETTLSQEAKFELAKAAVCHVLNAIAEDPRKFWLMGDFTGSYDKLTAAAAAIWEMPVEEVRQSYRPADHEWRGYLEEKEAVERLVEYCRDNGITPARDS